MRRLILKINFYKALVMRYSFFLTLVVLVFFVSCSKKQKDNSLTIREYQKMGIADPDRIWDYYDIKNTYDILNKLKWRNPYLMPIKESEKSGALFSRMISLDNMAFLDDKLMAPSEKAFQTMEFLSVFGSWNKLYSNKSDEKPYYHRELIDIYINGLRINQEMLELVNEMEGSDIAADIDLLEEFPSLKINYVTSLLNVLKLQSNASQFLESDLESLTDSITASILKNKNWMDIMATDLLKQSMETVIDSTSSDYIKNQYGVLTELL